MAERELTRDTELSFLLLTMGTEELGLVTPCPMPVLAGDSTQFSPDVCIWLTDEK